MIIPVCSLVSSASISPGKKNWLNGILFSHLITITRIPVLSDRPYLVAYFIWPYIFDGEIVVNLADFVL